MGSVGYTGARVQFIPESQTVLSVGPDIAVVDLKEHHESFYEGLTTAILDEATEKESDWIWWWDTPKVEEVPGVR